MGDTRHAEEVLARVEPMIDSSPTESAYAALAASERALLAQARGDLPAALTLMTRALKIVEGNPHSSSVPRYLTRRSAILLEIGQFEQARVDAYRAVGMSQNSPSAGPGSSVLGRAYLALGRVLLAQGKQDDARTAMSAAIEHLTASLGGEHPETRLARQLVSLPSLHPAVAREKSS
jgi:tetratricopeptide (TPR) repeat protein